MVVTKPQRRSRRPVGTSITLHERKDGLPENKKTSTPSGDTGNNKGTISSTPTGSLKVPPNFVLSKKILKKIEHRMEYVKKQESLPPPPSPLRQASVRSALNGVPFIEAVKTFTPKVKPAHREAKAQKAKTSKSDYNLSQDFSTAAQTIQPACQPQHNPEPASKPDKPPGTSAAPIPNAASPAPNNLSFPLGTTTPSAQTQKEKRSKTQPQTKAAPEAQGAGSTSTSCTTSITSKPAGTGSSSQLTFSPNSVSGRAQAARLRLKQMREDRSRAQPAEDRSRAQPAEDRSRAQPAEDRSKAQPAEDRSRAQPAEDSKEDRYRAQPAEDSRENHLSTEPPRASHRAPVQPPPRPLTPGPSQYRGPITIKQGQKPSRGQPEARPTTEGKKQPEVKPSTEGKKQPEVKPSEGKKQPEVKPSEGKSPQQLQEGIREASGFTRTHYTNWYVSNAQLPSFTEPMVAEATQLMDRYQKYCNEFHYPDGRGVVDFSKFSMSTTLGGKVDDPTEVNTAFEEWYSGINPFTPKTTTDIPTTQLPQASDSKPTPDAPAKAPPAQSRKKQTPAVAQSRRAEKVKTKDTKKEEQIEDIPPASPPSPKCPPYPSGCWHPFTVDKSCSRQARCQHRATNTALPPNITKWLNVRRNYLCEPPWVTTATLATSLALREREERLASDTHSFTNTGGNIYTE
ncbi:protein piccolo-like [Oncorhynchus nerka]|uniref:protein piccolo-like n=1 Tax=Oncorhynchus nerka TaxID=8023 RepID=UPI0031B7EB32